MKRSALSLLCLLLLCFGSATAADYQLQRQFMLKEIEKHVSETRRYLDKQEFDARVMDAMRKVLRHEFVPDNVRDEAYENRPLPIGHGQTISQPYIVALMTDLIGTRPSDRVLEIGTGSGYQAAILAELVADVYSMEIIKPLGDQAAQRLQRLGYQNIQTQIGDGYYGWPDAAPFDAIVVTAAASHVPPPLIQQLKAGGRMVIPIGSRFMTQQLLFVEKAHDGTVSTRQIMPVRFVPLTGQH
ncbi:MAG: protein-L-isoaspartate(D-aspartate) O-methyltransferase [Chromatiales bacterium]